jgi:hypothetical protein
MEAQMQKARVLLRTLALSLVVLAAHGSADAKDLYKKGPWWVTENPGSCNLKLGYSKIELYFTALGNGVLVVVEGTELKYAKKKAPMYLVAQDAGLELKIEQAQYQSIMIMGSISTVVAEKTLSTLSKSGASRIQILDGKRKLVAELSLSGLKPAFSAWAKCVKRL